MDLSPLRGDIVLNGVWQFHPDGDLPSQSWGLIHVPGNWTSNNPDNPGVIVAGADWRATPLESIVRATYQRQVTVPSHWRGRAVLLNVGRVSTDCEVLLDGKSCGRVLWPSGVVDISQQVTPGLAQSLELKVIAAADEQDVSVLMGVGQVSKTKASLAWRGLMGDVVIASRPTGPHIEDLAVETSTRKKTLALEVEFQNLPKAQPVQFSAKVFKSDGTLAREFTSNQTVGGTSGSKVRLEWRWANPKLWDVDHPNLYRLQLSAKAPGLRDEYSQAFGFREFWIEGKRFYLNGTVFNFRPGVGYEGGSPEVSNGYLRGMRRAGFNIQEIWPNNDENRGFVQFWESHVSEADKVGMPIMGPATHLEPVISWWHDERWSNPTDRARYLDSYTRNLRKYRNHPSILLWACSGNNFGSNNDQEPNHIGRTLASPIWNSENDRWKSHHAIGIEAYKVLKSLDPTRPILQHQGGPISDVYTANTYLNFLPLQEREEWLSAWAKSGEMPYCAVEFGTPLNASFFRGRSNWPNAQQSEPLVTEFGAIYLGPDVYRKESPAYRSNIAERLITDQRYSWTQGVEEHEWAFQAIESLFIRNTWRSWRTWDISGGMVPWSLGHGYDSTGNQFQPLDPWKPGQRGLRLPRVKKSDINPFTESTMPFRPAGVTLQSVNGHYLGWLSGDAIRWTEKQHSFSPGQTIKKSVVLINDSRVKTQYEFTVKTLVGTVTTPTANSKGELNVGERKIIPVEFLLPAKSPSGTGKIELTGTIGLQPLADQISFTIIPVPSPIKLEVNLYDPMQKSGAMLTKLGVIVHSWNGRDQSRPIIIGREAFSSPIKPPGDLLDFVQGGGHLLVLAQQREWLQQTAGFRVARPIARRAFVIDHVLGTEPLSDWRGSSTLISAYPDFRHETYTSKDSSPAYGWRWGAEGGVSSAVLEKPHTGGWRPLLETEFDLAYSPVMTLREGAGQIMICTLDLEDHYQSDPGALESASKVVSWLGTPSPEAFQTGVRYLGNADGARYLKSLGLDFSCISAFTPSKDLVVVGGGLSVTRAQEDAQLLAGGRMAYLAQANKSNLIQTEKVEMNQEVVEPPTWAEAAGLSLSDLHARVPITINRITSGCEVGASGLLGKRSVGTGTAIYIQFDPESLDSRKKTYLRLTRWRQTRTICQIIANMGGHFTDDASFLRTKQTTSRYLSDYRTDFELGDDPYRYSRW